MAFYIDADGNQGYMDGRVLSTGEYVHCDGGATGGDASSATGGGGGGATGGGDDGATGGGGGGGRPSPYRDIRLADNPHLAATMGSVPPEGLEEYFIGTVPQGLEEFFIGTVSDVSAVVAPSSSVGSLEGWHRIPRGRGSASSMQSFPLAMSAAASYTATYDPYGNDTPSVAGDSDRTAYVRSGPVLATGGGPLATGGGDLSTPATGGDQPSTIGIGSLQNKKTC